jgi:hypothetical protein
MTPWSAEEDEGMSTKMTSCPKPSAPATRVIWGSGEAYVCGDPDCRSRVLVLESPKKEPAHPTLPRCVCGNMFELAGSVSPVYEKSPVLLGEVPERDPAEERE